MSKCGRRRTPRIRDVRRRPRWIAIGKAIGRLRRSVSGGIGQIGVFLSPRLGGTANGIRTVRPGGLPLPNRSLFSPTPFVVSSPRRFAPICLSAAPCVKFFPPQVKDFPLFPEYWSEGRVRTRCPPASREKGFRHGLQLPIPLSPTGGRAPSPVLVQGICTESAINGPSGRTWTDGASVPPVLAPGN